MANEQHLKVLKQGVEAWNGWRKIERVDPDLSGADLTGALLEYVDLSGADLRGAILESAQLRGARLEGAELEGCTLQAAGVQEHLIAHYRSRAGASLPYPPVYIVHHRRDTGFAQMLFEQLQSRGVRCWLKPKTSFSSLTAVLETMEREGARVIWCASTTALEAEWAQELISGAISLERRGCAGFLVMDLDGCLCDDRRGMHGGWLRKRAVADLSRLASGEGRLEESIERLVERLRAGR